MVLPLEGEPCATVWSRVHGASPIRRVCPVSNAPYCSESVNLRHLGYDALAPRGRCPNRYFGGLCLLAALLNPCSLYVTLSATAYILASVAPRVRGSRTPPARSEHRSQYVTPPACADGSAFLGQKKTTHSCTVRSRKSLSAPKPLLGVVGYLSAVQAPF